MADKHHPLAALIISHMGKSSGDDGEGGDGHDDGLTSAVEDFCKASKAGEYDAAAAALRDAFDIMMADHDRSEAHGDDEAADKEEPPSDDEGY